MLEAKSVSQVDYSFKLLTIGVMEAVYTVMNGLFLRYRAFLRG